MHHAPFTRPWMVHFVRLLLVGLFTGLVAVAFRRSLSASATIRPWLMQAVGQGWLALVVSMAFSVAATLVAVRLVRRWCPEASGSGIPQTKALGRHPSPIRWLRLLLVKFSSGVLGIGGGLALGREGPTVQSGAALGEMIGSASRITPGERRQLLLLGAGAGLAGAFNAPLAGTLFVFEELGEEFKASTCMAAMLTTFAADLVCRALLEQEPFLGTYAESAPALQTLPLFLLLGWLGGVIGVVFNQTLLGTLRLAKWLRERLNDWTLPLGVACGVGLLGWLNPVWVGGGEELLRQLCEQRFDLNVVLFLLAMRFLLTIFSYSVGSAGGLFAPLLVLGGLMGGCIAELTHHHDRFGIIIVSMAALFSGIVRNPLTGVLLLMEITGAYTLTVPLFGACLVAKLTADALGDRPIYDALLQDFPVKQESPR